MSAALVAHNVRVRGRGATSRIRKRLERAGIAPPDDVIEALDAYLSLLTRWNRKINLTSLPLEPLSEQSLDRLLVEPVAAAAYVRANDRIAMDIGSGGGSPAIPLRIAAPHLRMILVESKVRKAAFLREAIRQLSLTDVEVENARVEELLPRPDLHEVADLVTLRAVRAEARLWTGIQAFLEPSGRVFWFGSGREPNKQQSLIMPFAIKSEHTLVTSTGSQLSILEFV